MFWVWILVSVLIIVGLSVVFAKVSAPRTRQRANPRDPVTALKASGALQHRKSNRP